MISETELSSFLFFDLETSTEVSNFNDLANSRKKDLWIKKVNTGTKYDKYAGGPIHAYEEEAQLFPEFGRIVCASFCYLNSVSQNGKMTWLGKFKSFVDTERSETSEVSQILSPISELLHNIDCSGKSMRLCGHNIKRFDIPWLCKKMIMNNVLVPSQLQIWGKKPWEITHFDTSEGWSMGNWDGHISLDLLSCVLNIPSPKEFMHGSYVGKTFWHENDSEKIRLYCEEDVKCVARICHKFSGSNLPIEFVSSTSKKTVM